MLLQDWGTAELLDALCGAGGAAYRLASLSGHANHFAEGVPGADHLLRRRPALRRDLEASHACPTLPAAGSASARPERRRLLLDRLPRRPAGARQRRRRSSSRPLDLPQAFLGRGLVGYLANTGFGWGLVEGPPGYGERMATLFTEELIAARTLSVGEAGEAHQDPLFPRRQRLLRPHPTRKA